MNATAPLRVGQALIGPLINQPLWVETVAAAGNGSWVWASSAPEKAVEKAEAGEEITFATAREIVAEARKKKRPRRQKTIPAEKLAGRLVTVLERYRARSDPKELAELAHRLREFADSLDAQKGGKKAKKE